MVHPRSQGVNLKDLKFKKIALYRVIQLQLYTIVSLKFKQLYHWNLILLKKVIKCDIGITEPDRAGSPFIAWFTQGYFIWDKLYGKHQFSDNLIS